MASETSATTSTQFVDTDVTDTLKRVRLVVEVYVVGTLCALGIAGNLLSIVVLGRDHTIRRTTGFLLQMLAVADVVYLVACVFYQTMNCIEQQTDWLPAFVQRRWPYIEVYAWPAASVAQTATVWMVVVLTADRYIAICRPLHAAQYSTVSRVRKAVAGVWIFTVVYNLPRFFERVVVVMSANFTSLTVTTSSLDLLSKATFPGTTAAVDSQRVVMQWTAMRESAVYVLLYKTCSFFVVRFLIPFATLAFVNQRLIRAMRESSRLREQATGGFGSGSSGGQKERQHTRILVVVVVVFVFCELPDLVLRAWMALHQNAPNHVAFPRAQLLYVNVASNLLLTVNSCINFVIYCLMGRRFRTILLRTLGCVSQMPPTSSVRSFQLRTLLKSSSCFCCSLALAAHIILAHIMRHYWLVRHP